MPKLRGTDLEITIERDRAPEPRGPEFAAEDAAKRFLGDPNGRSPEDLEAIDRRVFSQSVRRARLFKLDQKKDADDWAALRHRHEATSTVRILRIKELVHQTCYAQFVEWVEFTEPEEAVRATAVKEQEKLLSKLKPKPLGVAKPPRKKKVVDVPILLAEAGPLPSTHQALEDPK